MWQVSPKAENLYFYVEIFCKFLEIHEKRPNIPKFRETHWIYFLLSNNVAIIYIEMNLP